MYPSECGRALKYVTCNGKNGCSIISKRDAEKRQLLQRPNPNILPTILPKAPIILCRRDYMYNRKGSLKSLSIFPNKSQPQPTDNTRKKTNPTQVPPSPTQGRIQVWAESAPAPFWQLNHANSADFGAILATRPLFTGTRPPLFTNPGSGLVPNPTSKQTCTHTHTHTLTHLPIQNNIE